jgi:hypothetical protein
MIISESTIEWLLEGDPSVRWQTMRDLMSAKKSSINAERAKLETEGWCYQLLALQDPKGTWANALYSPKWISTTYTMLVLKDLGLPPQNPQGQKACKVLIDSGFAKDYGISFSPSWKRSETCITGMILSILAYFQYKDERIDKLVEHLLGQQMKDGGWNCQLWRGATHSSLHTTISVMEGLREYEKYYKKNLNQAKESQKKGIEFLLKHKLFRSHRTGEIINEKFTLFSFPPRWHYDILRALDYFQECKLEKDERMNESIEIVKKRQDKNGKWKLQNKHPAKVFFDLEKAGRSSRINTLRSLRILKWWESKREMA